MSAEESPQTLTIEKLAYGGDGLARVDGRVVFTPYVLPGEVVRAELRRAKNDLARGKLIDVVTPAPGRVAPPCPYFFRCGGCQYQHASYETQLEQKRLILLETLQRLGGISSAGDVEVVSAEPWQYRNRTQLHIAQGAIGYFEAGSRKLCAIDHCPISSPRLNEAIGALSRDLAQFRGFEATLELFTNETDLQVHVPDRVPASAWRLFEALGTTGPIEYDGFRVSPASFFQVNRFLTPRLVEIVTAGAGGQSAVDLYAGVGLFARALAQSFTKVAAVEPNPSAFHDLEHNMQSAEAITAERMTAEEYLAGLTEAPDLIVADPPRSGLGKAVIAELLRLHAPHVTIVACDPATLARDLRPLLERYRLERITLVDLFPQTFHLETVVRLSA